MDFIDDIEQKVKLGDLSGYNPKEYEFSDSEGLEEENFGISHAESGSD